MTCHTGISCGDMPWQYSYMLYGTCNTMFDTVYGIWFIILFTFGYIFYILYSSLSISTKLRSCAIYFDDSLFCCSCQPPEICLCWHPGGAHRREFSRTSFREHAVQHLGFVFLSMANSEEICWRFPSPMEMGVAGGGNFFPKRKDCGVDTSGT